MYDVVIKNGRVIDGAGNPWFRADIAVQGDRIVKISRGGIGDAERIVDAEGLVVAPGFIDSHTHSDGTVLENPIGMNFLTQGVTTVVTGECGNSLYPLTREAQRRVQERLEIRARDKSSSLRLNQVPPAEARGAKLVCGPRIKPEKNILTRVLHYLIS